MGRKTASEIDSCYQKCCVCLNKTSRNYTQVTQLYRKKQKKNNYQDEESLTIFDILENLRLLVYEIEDIEETAICHHCKKIILDFYDFKVMTGSKQARNELPVKDVDSSAPIDSIKKYLREKHYNKLKTYVVNNVIESIDKDDSNVLVIKPAMKIKTELDEVLLPNMHFVDTDVIVKIEKNEEPEMTFCDDENDRMSDVSELKESSSFKKHDDCSDDDNENETTHEDIFGTEENDENDEGITKTVIDNVTFISRIPECLVNLEQKRKEAAEAEKTRFKDPENWVRIKHRESRVRGESYVNRKGKLIKAKRIKAACNCRFQCTDRITEEDRKRNFENHWGLADFALQKKFLFEHRKTEPVARRRARYESARPREYSTKYYLDTYNKDGTHKSLEKVCEVMFCNTFDICKNNLRTLYKKVISGKVQDMRGTNRRKQTAGHLKAIDFVKQFPFFHIEQQMTVRQIYKNYVQECNEQSIDGIVKENTFRTIFSMYNESEFLKPNRPRPKCDICQGYEKASDAEKVHLQMEYDYHIRNTEICRNRRRWKKSSKAKAERRRIAKEQKLLQKEVTENQPQQVEPIEQEVLENYEVEMVYY
ncbi:unnamed protein product [Chironomus riparius]|uniref:ZAD domain-containing protein n=1 Tax=Chironomus riparius TaxID=315576 RepID=A0A9N9WN58_9DIPT|nr:unnamed protein product [Chironomus riparius]